MPQDSRKPNGRIAGSISGGDELLRRGENSPTEINSGEVRYIDPETGGEKGTKLARYDLIPEMPLHALAEHCGRGAAKYDDHNWRKGYPWSISFNALNRHLWAWWNGEDIDPELGSHHLDAVMWHALTLREYAEAHKERDDRPKMIRGTIGDIESFEGDNK